MVAVHTTIRATNHSVIMSALLPDLSGNGHIERIGVMVKRFLTTANSFKHICIMILRKDQDRKHGFCFLISFVLQQWSRKQNQGKYQIQPLTESPIKRSNIIYGRTFGRSTKANVYQDIDNNRCSSWKYCQLSHFQDNHVGLPTVHLLAWNFFFYAQKVYTVLGIWRSEYCRLQTNPNLSAGNTG